MKIAMLHHVSVVTSDLARSTAFYRDVLGLSPLPRPPFSVSGAWFSLGRDEMHLVVNADGSFPTKTVIDRNDSHFAIRVENFEDAISHLLSKGFREDAPEDDPLRIAVSRKSAAGYPQAYLLDPDRHVIEINAIAG